MGRTSNTLNDFWKMVDKTDGCWNYVGTVSRTGYGHFSMAGKVYMAHRVAYTALIGELPAGVSVDHKCHNQAKVCKGGWECSHRRCVNPAHLEAVTQRENVLRGHGVAAFNSKKTHCKNGHEFTPDNTYTRSWGGRECWACKRARRKLNNHV